MYLQELCNYKIHCISCTKLYNDIKTNLIIMIRFAIFVTILLRVNHKNEFFFIIIKKKEYRIIINCKHMHRTHDGDAIYSRCCDAAAFVLYILCIRITMNDQTREKRKNKK